MVPCHSDEELLGVAGKPATRRSPRALALQRCAAALLALLGACCCAALASSGAALRGAARSSDPRAAQQKSGLSDMMDLVFGGIAGRETPTHTAPGSGGAEHFACGRIPATNVFDVQWSGDETQTVQACSGFDEPFDPRTGSRLQVDLQSDYFELISNRRGGYSLQQFDKHGNLKFDLLGGEVKLANSDMAFYIIDGWYGTIITRSSSYSYGDSDTFAGLARDPVLSCTGVEGVANAEDVEGDQAKGDDEDVDVEDVEGVVQAKTKVSGDFACGRIPATNVFDVQWSGDQTQSVQACSSFQEPFDPRAGSHLKVDLQNDYFELVWNKSGGYSLQQFDKHGYRKFDLWGGDVKLANSDMVFYIIDGWYGTIITRSSNYSYGDSATFTGLARNPELLCTGAEGVANAEDVEGDQAKGNTSGAQSQGKGEIEKHTDDANASMGNITKFKASSGPGDERP